jgi:adenylosuccinate lyase
MATREHSTTAPNLPPANAATIAMVEILTAVVKELPRRRRARIIRNLEESGCMLAIGRIRVPSSVHNKERSQASELVRELADCFRRDLVEDEAV